MYASKTVVEHLLRGAVSAGLMWGTVHFSHEVPWAFFVTFPLAVVLWRGCPTCWLTGLFHTVRNTLTSR